MIIFLKNVRHFYKTLDRIQNQFYLQHVHAKSYSVQRKQLCYYYFNDTTWWFFYEFYCESDYSRTKISLFSNRWTFKIHGIWDEQKSVRSGWNDTGFSSLDTAANSLFLNTGTIPTLQLSGTRLAAVTVGLVGIIVA